MLFGEEVHPGPELAQIQTERRTAITFKSSKHAPKAGTKAMDKVVATGARRLSYFDTARALAAFMVVCVHTESTFHASSPLASTFAEMGQLGVQLFFVVSAFLIFNSLDRLSRNGGCLVEYWAHRFLRIAPLYYVAIMGWTVFGLVADAGVPCRWPQILANVVFIHGIIPSANNSIVGGGWSVGTEFLFYLVAPLMFSWRNTPIRIACAAALCLPLMLAGTHYLQPLLNQPQYIVDNGFLYFSIVNQFPVFACGMLLYCFRQAVFRLPLVIVISGLVLPSVAMYWIWQNHFADTLTFFFVPLFAAVSFVFLLALLQRTRRMPSVIAVIGQRSFSIYLLNGPVLVILKHIRHELGINIPFLLALLVMTASTLLLSCFTYRFIEEPFINLSKRLLSPKEAIGKVASATSNEA
jgi:peptidoglycan/LPS O-acetylase OafA/YrhL